MTEWMSGPIVGRRFAFPLTSLPTIRMAVFLFVVRPQWVESRCSAYSAECAGVTRAVLKSARSAFVTGQISSEHPRAVKRPVLRLLRLGFGPYSCGE